MTEEPSWFTESEIEAEMYNNPKMRLIDRGKEFRPLSRSISQNHPRREAQDGC